MLTSKKPMIALTFDDGPIENKSYGYEILNILKQYGLNATFFYCGSQINNETAKEIAYSYALGNEIGNHTTHHLALTDLSDANLKSEVETTAKLLHKITDLTQFLVRPPYLACAERVFKLIDAPLIGASVDSKDWSGIEPELIIKNVLTHVTDGSIILMHENQVHTVTALKTLIPKLLELGFTITTVSKLMQAKGIPLTNNRLYEHA